MITGLKMLCYSLWRGKLMSTFAPAMREETVPHTDLERDGQYL